MTKKFNEVDTSYYTNFWENNLKSVEDIEISLKKMLLDLKQKKLLESEIHETISSKINLLASMYSSYNTLKGREYILKLKTTYEKYLDHEIKKNAYLGTLDFLMDKISFLKDESFKKFPHISHSEEVDIDQKIHKFSMSKEKEYAHRWVCFMRNGSSFIVKYNKIILLNASKSEVTNQDGDNILTYFDRKYILVDFFKESVFKTYENPPIIIVADGKTAYAADTIEKKYLAQKDLLAKKIEPFDYTDIRAKGYIKLSGKRYILLSNKC